MAMIYGCAIRHTYGCSANIQASQQCWPGIGCNKDILRQIAQGFEYRQLLKDQTLRRCRHWGQYVASILHGGQFGRSAWLLYSQRNCILLLLL
jgi:hypothetical protein